MNKRTLRIKVSCNRRCAPEESFEWRCRLPEKEALERYHKLVAELQTVLEAKAAAKAAEKRPAGGAGPNAGEG